MDSYLSSDKSIPRSVIASLLIIGCLIAGASPNPVSASPCKYSTSWFYLHNQGVTDCELLDMEDALSLEAKNFSLLSPFILRVGHVIDEEAGDELIPYFAFAILNTPERYPFDERLQLRVQCESMEGESWKCETIRESHIVYHHEKAILVFGASESEALTVAKGFDSTPIEALIEVLGSDDYEALAPMFREIGWPETLQSIYSIRKKGDIYSLSFGGWQCSGTTIRVKRSSCGDPACELDLQDFSWVTC